MPEPDPQPDAVPTPEPVPGAQAATPKRHTAPITPLVHMVRFLGVILVVVLVQFASAAQHLNAAGWLGGGALALLVVAVVGGLVYLQWRRLLYWFDDDGDLRVSSGIFQHRERRLQLSRLQSVEVVQPLIARIFGMAEVRVEVAGSGDARITLAYLTLDAATALRAETLARAAGVRPDAGEAPEHVLVVVPNGVLLKSSLLHTTVWLILAVELLAIIVAFAAGGLAVGLGLVIALIVPVMAVFGSFATYFNFTVADSPDGLRTRFGLFGVRSHTVPPGRVAAVEFVEPLLWRHFGWVAVRITVAGTGSGDDSGENTASMLLPVATWEVATGLVHRLLPGVDIAAIDLRPAPPAARRRSPFQWRALAVGWDPRVLLTRRGWLIRRTAITPHARVQSVRLTQGPWERALGLSSVHFDIVPGPVRPVALRRGNAEAADLLVAEARRVLAATAADSSLRWGRAADRGAAAAPSADGDGAPELAQGGPSAPVPIAEPTPDDGGFPGQQPLPFDSDEQASPR
ncbi:MAG: hypothetical protein E6Q57_01255 [Mycobacterium sp.]|nr:MAG: hypothetical protein E6Q57_01255 [Mycobacterium sp.]